MNALLLWDKEGLTDAIANVLSIESDFIIKAVNALKAYKTLHDRDAVLVLLETNIDEQQRAFFYGLDLIKILRKELRYKGLIIAYSFCDAEQLKALSNSKVLLTSGIRLQSISKDGIESSKIEKLIDEFSGYPLCEAMFDGVKGNKEMKNELIKDLQKKLNVIKRNLSISEFINEVNIHFENYQERLSQNEEDIFGKLYNGLMIQMIQLFTNTTISEAQYVNMIHSTKIDAIDFLFFQKKLNEIESNITIKQFFNEVQSVAINYHNPLSELEKNVLNQLFTELYNSSKEQYSKKLTELTELLNFTLHYKKEECNDSEFYEKQLDKIGKNLTVTVFLKEVNSLFNNANEQLFFNSTIRLQKLFNELLNVLNLPPLKERFFILEEAFNYSLGIKKEIASVESEFSHTQLNKIEKNITIQDFFKVMNSLFNNAKKQLLIQKNKDLEKLFKEIKELLIGSYSKEQRYQLSEELLDDICYYIWDSKGKLHELLHDFEDQLHRIKVQDSIEGFLEKIDSHFEYFKKQFLNEIDPIKTNEFEILYNELLVETKKDILEQYENCTEKKIFSYNNAGVHINRVTQKIEAFAPISEENINVEEKEKYSWKVLFLDDNDEIGNKVVAYFHAKDVTCKWAKTEDNVFEMLKELGPYLAIFISDIRLKVDENWYDKQGYDILERVNKVSEIPLVYAVLTSKKGSISRMLRKKREFEVLWFTKNDVLANENSFNIFFDQIKEYAEKTFQGNSVFKILGKNWLKAKISVYDKGSSSKSKKDGSLHEPIQTAPSTSRAMDIFYRFPLQDYYKKHRESLDYTKAEIILNEKTRQISEDDSLNPYNWRKRLSLETIDQEELDNFRNVILLGRRLFLHHVFFELDKNTDDFKELLQAAYEKVFLKNSIETKEKAKNDNLTPHNTLKVYLSSFCISTDIQETIKQIKSYFKHPSTSVEILQEEYEYLKEEFLDVYAEEKLETDEWNSLKLFFELIPKYFGKDYPRSIDKVNKIFKESENRLLKHELLQKIGVEIAEKKMFGKSRQGRELITEFTKQGTLQTTNESLTDFYKRTGCL